MTALLRRLFDLSRRLACLPSKAERPAPSVPAQSPGTPTSAMDVNSGNFSSEVIKIIDHVANSRFIAFDLEFSGVARRRAGGGANRLSLQDYYSDLRSAAQIYQILQVGFTVVAENTKKGM